MSLARNEPSDPQTDIGIIGMAGRFPGAKNVEQFWANVAAGVESISRFTDEELLASGVPPDLLHNPRYVKARGILEDAEWFDAPFFGMSPTEALVVDPQHRLFLECSWEALEHAGYAPDKHSGVIGVYAGAGSSQHARDVCVRTQLYEALGGYFTQLGNDPDFLTTRVCTN